MCSHVVHLVFSFYWMIRWTWHRSTMNAFDVASFRFQSVLQYQEHMQRGKSSEIIVEVWTCSTDLFHCYFLHKLWTFMASCTFREELRENKNKTNSKAVIFLVNESNKTCPQIIFESCFESNVHFSITLQITFYYFTACSVLEYTYVTCLNTAGGLERANHCTVCWQLNHKLTQRLLPQAKQSFHCVKETSANTNIKTRNYFCSIRNGLIYCMHGIPNWPTIFSKLCSLH